MQDALYVTHGSKPQANAKASVITKNYCLDTTALLYKNMYN